MENKTGTEKIMSCSCREKCGGCSSIGRPYGDTLREKEAEVRKLLKPFVRPEPIVGMENPYHYRNKLHRAYGYETRGKREQHLSGIYAEHSHRIVPVKSCLIEDEAGEAIFRTIEELAAKFRIRSYNEDSRQGLLRHVLLRTAHATGQIMVVLVLTSPVLPGKNAFVKLLRERHPGITTIVINVNNRATSMLLGEKESVAFGRGYIEDVLGGKTFRISSKSFYQVNSVQTERLYAKAIEMASLQKSDCVLDAYCGIGTIGLIASDQAGSVIGVESNRAAVRDAVENAKRNGVKNISFVAEDSGEYLTRLAALRGASEKRPDVLIMDPPRSGASESFLKAAALAHPSRIVYISCSPETLARDLKALTASGYRVERAQAFDMFPWTKHVETVCLLTHKA